MTDGPGVRDCSIARALEVVGEKWTLLAVRELMLGSRRFEEIVRHTGAPRDILTTRLRKLEERGLVERVQYQSRPDRFEYRLTERGWSLHQIITMLRDWGDQQLIGDDGPPALFRHDCGEIYHPAVCCEACGKVVEPDALLQIG
ncbi:MAG: helix-turn-helix domain-containing protein [Marmoricola sp.]